MSSNREQLTLDSIPDDVVIILDRDEWWPKACDGCRCKGRPEQCAACECDLAIDEIEEEVL